MDDSLIKRQDAIKEVSEWATDILHPQNLIKEDTIHILESLPSAEPKTGKWNRLSNDTFHCKSCGCTFIVMQGNDAMNYCPNCGSYNGGEEE